MESFVYPPWIHIDKLFPHPGPFPESKNVFLPFPGYPDRRQNEWSRIYHEIDKKYGQGKATNKRQVVERVLPKDTVVYHAHVNKKKNVFSTKSEIMYFGLDFMISAWILAEKWGKHLRSLGETAPVPSYAKWVGYVDVFVTKRDIKYTYVYEDECTPEDCSSSQDIYKEKPIVHPQVAFHDGWSGDDNYCELGVEMTNPVARVQDDLEHIGYHCIDIVKLMLFRTKSLVTWKPHNAIKSSTVF